MSASIDLGFGGADAGADAFGDSGRVVGGRSFPPGCCSRSRSSAMPRGGHQRASFCAWIIEGDRDGADVLGGKYDGPAFAAGVVLGIERRHRWR